jgi:hypothetical protein
MGEVRLRAGRALLAFLTVLAVAGAAAAQSRTGTIAGVVTGDDGNRLPGVTVTAENPSAGVRRTAITDADGRFDISELPADGDYIVGASLAGFAVATPERVTIGADRRATANFVLKVSLIESVAVTARSPLLEEDQSRVQQTISDKLVHTLPLVGRNFLPLASLAAGFTATPTSQPAGPELLDQQRARGRRQPFLEMAKRAADVLFRLQLEAIKELRVMTSRFSAEYGDALATVTTALTRSGDEEFHGSALMFVQNGALNSRRNSRRSSRRRTPSGSGSPRRTADQGRERTRFLEVMRAVDRAPATR